MTATSSLRNIRALLVHNSNAGTDPVPRSDIESVLRAAGIEPTYCAHGVEDLDAALEGRFDLVISAGGDGTLAHIASCHRQSDVPIAVLPLGGSNNLAHALDVGGAWRDLPERWSLDHWRSLDRCEADGPWGRRRFVEAIGAGVLTRSVDEVDDAPATPEEKRANGRAAFRDTLATARPFYCRVETGEWDWEGDCLLIEVMSISLVGPRLRLAVNADPGDGLFDVVIVAPDDRAAMLEWARAPDDGYCPVASRQASMVRLSVEDQPFRLDDRCPDDGLSGVATIRIRPQPIKVLVPQQEIVR